MNKIKITGLGGIPFIDGDEPQENKDYALTIICSLHSIENLAKHGEETAPKYYKLKVDRVEQLLEVGDSKPKRIRQGRTESQKIRWLVEQIAKLTDKDEEELYKIYTANEIKKLGDRLDTLGK